MGVLARPVAIIGVGFRLPGDLSDLDLLKSALFSGKDLISDLPEGRWQNDLYDPEGGRAGSTYVRRGGYVDGIDLFDAEFFNLSPREASRVDPQHRMLLETAIEALDCGGLVLEQLAGRRVGVYVGISSNDYGQLQNRDPRSANAYTNTGSALSIAANRISYFLDVRGPSLAIDTACSSGLTAFDQAVRAIGTGACEIAIAASANALLMPEPYVNFCAAQMLSPVGQCRAFDAEGAGFVRAEGAVAFVLKDLEAALAGEDPIFGTICASDCNNDGRTTGLSLPSAQAQTELLDRIYGTGGIAPDDVIYLEAHGTGTAAGDPIEAEAIGTGIGRKRTTGPLPIGSIKTNFGHLEPASGLAGLLKALVVLDSGRIPPSLHFDRPNPNIPFDQLNIVVANRSVPIAAATQSRKVGVNSFGFGGANAHVVVESPPDRPAPPDPVEARPWFLLSARSKPALCQFASRLAESVAQESRVNLSRLSATLRTRRSWHSHRAAFRADTQEDLAAALAALAAGQPTADTITDTALPTSSPVFVFTGNGPQWWAMGRQLLANEPTFRETIEELHEAFEAIGHLRLIDEMMKDEAHSRMAATEVAQPALFALQAGLVRLLADAGISPGAVVGHSAGELAASFVAGRLDLATATRVVFARSHNQGKTAGTGTMAAIGFGAEEADALVTLQPGLVVAGDNSANATTIAGPVAAVEALVAEIEAAGAFARKLRLDYAFHSPLMDGIESDFRADVGDVRDQGESIPFYSTVTGARASIPLDVDYWWRNLREPVLFRSAVEAMLADGYRIFLEVGPHPNLTGYIAAAAGQAHATARTVETLRRETDEIAAMDRTVMTLAVAGGAIDRTAGLDHPVRPLPLPRYPWQRDRHYHIPKAGGSLSGDATGHPLLGRRLPTARPCWVNVLSNKAPSFLADHAVRGKVLFPAAGFLEVAVGAARSLGADGTIVLHHVAIEKPLPLEEGREVLLQTTFDQRDQSFSIASREDGSTEPFVEHARGTIEMRPSSPRRIDFAPLRSADATIGSDGHYAAVLSRGLEYGPAFQVVDRIAARRGSVAAELSSRITVGGLVADPTLVDGALQAMIALIDDSDRQRSNDLYLPVAVDRMVVRGSPADTKAVVAHVSKRAGNSAYLRCDIAIATPNGDVLVELSGMEVRRVGVSDGNAGDRYVERLVRIGTASSPMPRICLSAISTEKRHPTSLSPVAKSDWDQQVRTVAAAFAARAFHAIAGDGPFTIAGLVENGQLAARHAAYANAILNIAAVAGIAAEKNGQWSILAQPDPRAAWQTAYSTFTQAMPDWLVLWRIGDWLTDILAGTIDPLEVLFSAGAATLIQHYYENGAAMEPGNAAATEALRQIVAQMPRDRVIKVLEIGAGTGGTTAALLPGLPHERTDYLFTDVSSTFLREAENRFGAYTSFRTALLDVSQQPDVAALGGPFDVVVAANVLHATPHVVETLRNARACLTENGTLVQIELAPCAYFDFVFGTLPGAWLFEQDPLRATGCLLPGQHWKAVAERAGFEDVAIVANPGLDGAEVSSLILGRAPACAAEPAHEAIQASRSVLVIDLGDSGMGEAIRADRPEAVVFSAPAVSEVGFESLRPWEAYLHADVPVEDIVVIAPERTLAAKVSPDEGFLLVSLVQAISKVKWPSHPRLTVVTEGTHTSPTNLSAAAYHAVGRTVVNEASELHCRRIDVERSATARKLAIPYILGDSQEDELLVTENSVFKVEVSPLTAATRRLEKDEAVQFAASLTHQGSINNLRWRACPARSDPGRREIVVDVRVAGVNFKDVILALGLLPPSLIKEDSIGLLMGLEGAGEVVSVGPSVTEFAPGDRVMFESEGSFASRLSVDAGRARKVPPHWSYIEAATVPIVALTVIYSLEMLARLAPGETLLVHGGTGGVGLAAINYAKAIGARVIATAGTPEKRDLLKACGVDFVSDSRSLAFVEAIQEYTGGEGVDVVLNSLAGEAMHASLALVKPYGRFVELGKRDISANNRLNMRALEQNVSFFAVDLTGLFEARPAIYAEIWDRMLDNVRNGAVRPLPARVYAASRLREAFRHMQAGNHIGKLVISMRKEGLVLEEAAAQPPRLSSDGAYCITGGLGGLGLAVAEWMVERGARRIVLAGRRGVTTDAQRCAIGRLEAAGAAVRVACVDTSDEADIRAFLTEIRSTDGPIRGIVHSVLQLDDRVLADLDRDNYIKVAAPKVTGALALDRLTRDDPLDIFVCFSSVAGVIGNPGQAAYAAANAVLEAIVRARREASLPGLSLALGAVRDAGFVARDADLLKRLERTGMASISTDDVRAALDDCLASSARHAIVSSFAGLKLPITTTARFAGVVGDGEDPTACEPEDVVAMLSPLDAEERLAVATLMLAEVVAQMLHLPSERIAPDRSLLEMGLDSLMLVELQVHLRGRFRVEFSASDLQHEGGLRSLAALLLMRLDLVAPDETEPTYQVAAE